MPNSALQSVNSCFLNKKFSLPRAFLCHGHLGHARARPRWPWHVSGRGSRRAALPAGMTDWSSFERPRSSAEMRTTRATRSCCKWASSAEPVAFTPPSQLRSRGSMVKSESIILYALRGMIEDDYGNPLSAQSTPDIGWFGGRGRGYRHRKEPPADCSPPPWSGAANRTGIHGGPLSNPSGRRGRYLGSGWPQGAVEGKAAR